MADFIRPNEWRVQLIAACSQHAEDPIIPCQSCIEMIRKSRTSTGLVGAFLAAGEEEQRKQLILPTLLRNGLLVAMNS